VEVGEWASEKLNKAYMPGLAVGFELRGAGAWPAPGEDGDAKGHDGFGVFEGLGFFWCLWGGGGGRGLVIKENTGAVVVVEVVMKKQALRTSMRVGRDALLRGFSFGS
jgi:hypothetical protein